MNCQSRFSDMVTIWEDIRHHVLFDKNRSSRLEMV